MKKSKKVLGLVFMLALVFALVACKPGIGATSDSNSSSSDSTVETSSNDGTSVGSSSENSSGTSSEDSSGGSSSEVGPTAPATAGEIKMNGTKYDTLSAALAAVPTDSAETFVITLGKGTYEESGLGYNGSATIKISGDTTAKYGTDVVIVGHGSDMTTEKTRSLIAIQGSGNIILENLTLKSDWSRARAEQEGLGSNTQAEVLGTDTKGNTVAYNCSFKSNQDTLRTAGKAWFYDCYIEGDVDFIWMEQAGQVALYEKCEIVSVYDADASTHRSYVTAPRMAISTKVGKGLVIFNSTVKESADAKANGQQTYLGRSPWTSGYFSQVAYINTTCQDVEAGVWYGNPIPSDYARTVIGWKMDQATATSLNYTGDDILDADTVSKEFSGRKTILNRIYNTGKQKYEKDNLNNWDIDALITANGWTVDADTSSDILQGEVVGEITSYPFDGTVDQSTLCNGFAVQTGKPHYVGQNGATITIPVKGKCYVEVYGYYSGTLEAKANTQGEAVMFFNNSSTSAEVLNTYIVYDENATSVVLTAKATTYITKVVVTTDSTIQNTPVSSIEVSSSSTLECVGVALTLSAKATPTATNKSVKWSSSDTTIADIDTYTGRVTFKNEGEVTFTATACDGSGTTGTFTCNPVNPKWTAIEWYTTDSDIKVENGADGIENFSYGASTAYKSISGATYTFTNIAGQSISTTKGLKLNSSGELIVATTKSQAKLTAMVGKSGTLATPTPVVSDGTTTLTPVSTETIAEGLTVYVYDLATAGTWSITRGDNSVECSPIVYAKCEYETTISKSTFVNYKGGAYSAPAGYVSFNHNNETDGSIVATADEVTLDNITYIGASSNGTDNWLKFNTGATIKFKASSACTLNIYFYNGTNNASVALDGNAVTTATETQTSPTVPYVYEITAGGEVVITATANGYLGAFEVVFATAA